MSSKSNMMLWAAHNQRPMMIGAGIAAGQTFRMIPDMSGVPRIAVQAGAAWAGNKRTNADLAAGALGGTLAAMAMGFAGIGPR